MNVNLNPNVTNKLEPIIGPEIKPVAVQVYQKLITKLLSSGNSFSKKLIPVFDYILQPIP